ncbi:MepB family protein [Paenarthrobacter histidinolovorans]|uniref:MepB family protein n=1 Tax=Paenarthrobacter histidinolovorans TaxID=43664 RepID=UPI00166E0EAB|nr:MepB family protein [Paenarthrobacter histidinolovorans]GGJ35295.1 metallopeptidase [Paenarthrobacter histidinolovorans]
MNFHAFERFVARQPLPDDSLGVVHAEEQNSDYESGVALIAGEQWRIRTARITPTKPGAFVAVWKRDDNGSTRPFTVEESLSGLLVFVEDRGEDRAGGRERFGAFRFTPEQLISLGYVSSGPRSGKRGFRVYPSWCTDLNPQALRTQRGQAAAFVEFPSTCAASPAALLGTASR